MVRAIWPRISPLGCATVETFTYESPATSAEPWLLDTAAIHLFDLTTTRVIPRDLA